MDYEKDSNASNKKLLTSISHPSSDNEYTVADNIAVKGVRRMPPVVMQGGRNNNRQIYESPYATTDILRNTRTTVRKAKYNKLRASSFKIV